MNPKAQNSIREGEPPIVSKAKPEADVSLPPKKASAHSARLSILFAVLVLFSGVGVLCYFADDLSAWNADRLDRNEMPQIGEKSDVVLERLGGLDYDGRNWGEPDTDFDFSCANRCLVYHVRVRAGEVSKVTTSPRRPSPMEFR